MATSDRVGTSDADLPPAARLTIVGLGTFLVVGLGIGVAGYFSIDAFGATGGGFGAQLLRSIFVVVSVVVVALVGAPVAATVGVRAGASEVDEVRAYAVVAGTSVVGHVVMFVVAVSIIGSKLSEGSGGGGIDLGRFLGPMFLAGVGVALAGVAVTALVHRLDP